MYVLNGEQPQELESTTFAELNMKESDIEEILRKNIDIVCNDEDTMLIVGQQVRNENNGRSDLTAVDGNGDIVLIEIKRDRADIKHRKEAFEFQAIRYAASCATIKSTDELIQDIFAPYIEKHLSEFAAQEGLTSSEIAKRKLEEFLRMNDIKIFNAHQRIILIASEFDEQTLSAVAWLNSNQVDISCYQLSLKKLGDTVLFDVEKKLPIAEYDDFYVNVASRGSLQKKPRKDISRRTLPKIDSMLKWGVVKPGDVLVAKGTEHEAVLQEDGMVKVNGEVTSIQKWLKSIFNWSSVQTYVMVVHKESGKLLSELRSDYMENNDIDS